jgi:hypothetical protein
MKSKSFKETLAVPWLITERITLSRLSRRFTNAAAFVQNVCLSIVFGHETATLFRQSNVDLHDARR